MYTKKNIPPLDRQEELTNTQGLTDIEDIVEINEAPKRNTISEKEKKKKYRLEILAAILLLFFMAIITWGQLNSFGSDPWIFFVLINVNAILMLVVLFLVARNIIRLLLERRRKIFGSRIRTRLVLAFFSISFIPILIMFLASNRILTTSVNYWFTGQVENSMQAALDVGHSFYNAASNRLKTQTELFAKDLSEQPTSIWGTYLNTHKQDNHFTLLGIMELQTKTQNQHTQQSLKNTVVDTQNTANDVQIYSLNTLDSLHDFAPSHTQNIEQNTTQETQNIIEDTVTRTNSLNTPPYKENICFATPTFSAIWSSLRHSINFSKINESGVDALSWSDAQGDYVIIALPIPNKAQHYIIAGESIGKGLLTQLSKISTGFEEYTELKNLKQPLKLSFSLILALLSLIVLFASIWLAFRLSREITEPILALAKSTKQLAEGDWDIQITDKGQDELSDLVHSFNYMTAQMHKSQNRLHQLYWLIEHNNTALIERNQYIEAILEHITTGVATLDDKGTLITINKAVCDIFKIRAEQYEGLSFSMFLNEEHRNIIEEMYLFLQQNPEQTWVREVELLVQEQYSKLLIQALPLPSFLRDNKDSKSIEEPLSNMISHYTKIKNTQAENVENDKEQEELNLHIQNQVSDKKNNAYLTGNIILVIEDITALSQEQRLLAWREVARRIAHEIKNPLTPIKLSTERIKRKFAKDIQDPVFTQCTDLIIQEVARMQTMVKDFSDFAALPSVQLELNDPMPILKNLTTLFTTSHSSIIWEIIQKTDIPKILLDKEALHRALFNILSNASDAIQMQKNIIYALQTKNNILDTINKPDTSFTEPDLASYKEKKEQNPQNTYQGNVKILCYTSKIADHIPHHATDETSAHITDTKTSTLQSVIIEIIDNGAGIKAEEAARLFEPYFSKKATGTGLGLAIVRSIISDHGGTISAHKKENGTCIRITLPIYKSGKQIQTPE